MAEETELPSKQPLLWARRVPTTSALTQTGPSDGHRLSRSYYGCRVGGTTRPPGRVMEHAAGKSPNLSQTLMRWRVGLQFLAILLMMTLVYLWRQ